MEAKFLISLLLRDFGSGTKSEVDVNGRWIEISNFTTLVLPMALVIIVTLPSGLRAEDSSLKNSVQHAEESHSTQITTGPLDRLENILRAVRPSPVRVVEVVKNKLTNALLPLSDLPGFPGASNIYHIGSTGFFIDFASVLNFADYQLAMLKKIRDQSQLRVSTADQKVSQAEEDLWMLTASDRPDLGKIDSKVHEIESLKSEMRISFIRDVGEAASILTPEQRSVLVESAASHPVGSNPVQILPPQMPQAKIKLNASKMNSMGDM
jgi:hypothetical protein